MDTAEVRMFWNQWLFDEQGERLDEREFQEVMEKGNLLIEGDVEFWQRQSMWQLFDAVKN
jgi:hypothetical protein